MFEFGVFLPSTETGTVSTKSKLEFAAGLVLAASTLAVAVIVVEQRVRPSRQSTVASRIDSIAGWDERSASARSPVTDSKASVRVDVFTDFECPFCEVLDSVLHDTEKKYPGRFSRTVIHFPLPMHAGAKPAAEAFECAALAGRALPMSAALYRATDLSRTRMDSLATFAGIQDTKSFSACLLDSTLTLPRINAGIALSQDLALRSTPTVVVNGWIFDPAQPASIVRAIERAMDGKSPSP